MRDEENLLLMTPGPDHGRGPKPKSENGVSVNMDCRDAPTDVSGASWEGSAISQDATSGQLHRLKWDSRPVSESCVIRPEGHRPFGGLSDTRTGSDSAKNLLDGTQINRRVKSRRRYPAF